MVRPLAVLALALATFACDGGSDDDLQKKDSGPPDLGFAPDAEVPDAGEVDTGPIDAGPLPVLPDRFSEVTCADCAACDAALCLRASTGEQFCSDRCDTDLEGCTEGFTCLDVTGGGATPAYFCVPPIASCLGGIGLGSRCIGDAEACLPIADHCEGDFHNFGYCTIACAMPSDCPAGWACGPGDDGDDVCHPTYVAPAEMCARTDDVGERPCAVDTDCGELPGSICVRSEPSLPGVCAFACDAASGCDAERACRTTHRGDVCLSDRCACHASRLPPGSAPGTRDLLEEALMQVGLTPCSLLFDVFAWTLVPPDVQNDPYRFSFYDAVHNEPLRAPDFAERLIADLDTAADGTASPAAKAARMIERMAQLADHPPVRQDAQPIDVAEPLVQAVAALITTAGGAPDLAALRADAADVPMDLQIAIATVIEGVERAYVARTHALGNAAQVSQLYDYGAAFVAPRRDGFGLAPANSSVRTLLTQTFGYDDMYGGAVDLLDAIADADLARFAAVPTATTATTAGFLFSQSTPIGRIAIGDGENGIYDPSDPEAGGDFAVLLDLGGDDTYRVPAGGNASSSNAVSVLIDLGGDDHYGYVEVPDMLDGARLPSDAGGRYQPRSTPDMDNGPISLSETPRQGGGRMGTAVLMDLGGGNDHYQSLRMSQGSGIFGTGVLIDDGGDDTYLAEAVAQGAGAFGLGLLLDLGGNDHREAYTMAQGFAFAQAVGLIYDTDGDDDYLMDPGDPTVGGDPLYFSGQRPGRANTTLGQGYGFGRRADTTDRAFMSGGVGILIDGAGADRYQGSVFAQGGGFWFSTGILADKSGDDAYDSLWYGMASAAHYSLGLLLDGGGNDTYGQNLPRVNVTIAGAHDYSAVFLIDESGDDMYFGSRITVGSGNSNGIGVLVDNAGDDQYAAASLYSIGSAGLLEGDDPGSAKRKVPSIGVFIDAGGTDGYTFSGNPIDGKVDDAIWRSTNNADPLVQRVELGTGVDGTGESTLHFP